MIIYFFHLFFSIDDDSNSEGGIQSPAPLEASPLEVGNIDCAPVSPALSAVNDVIKSESHDNIFSAPKFGSELKRRASDVSLSSLSSTSRPASLNLNYSQRGAPEKSKKAKPMKQRTRPIKFHEYKVRLYKV